MYLRMRTGTKDDWNRLQLNLDDADLKLLLERAKEEKLPKSEILRRALRMYCSTPAQTLPMAVGADV
jgi:hypothetical protein